MFSKTSLAQIGYPVYITVSYTRSGTKIPQKTQQTQDVSKRVHVSCNYGSRIFIVCHESLYISEKFVQNHRNTIYTIHDTIFTKNYRYKHTRYLCQPTTCRHQHTTLWAHKKGDFVPTSTCDVKESGQPMPEGKLDVCHYLLIKTINDSL